MRQISTVLAAAALLGTTLAAAGPASAGERGLFTSGAVWGSPCCEQTVRSYSYVPHVTYSQSYEVRPHYREVWHRKVINHEHTYVHQHLNIHQHNIVDREIVQHRVKLDHRYSTRHVHQYRNKTEVRRSRQIEHRGKAGCCD